MDIASMFIHKNEQALHELMTTTDLEVMRVIIDIYYIQINDLLNLNQFECKFKIFYILYFYSFNVYLLYSGFEFSRNL